MTGQTVVITGAASGLGAGMARLMSAKGARVALLDRDAGPLDQVVADCPGSRGWAVDVTDADGLARIAQEVAEHFGGIDALVVSAGVGGGGLVLHGDPDAFERIIEINLMGSIRTTRAFLPHLVSSKGYVLQIASLAAFIPAPMMGAYCASKSGVEAFAHCLRGEVAHHGVDVGVAYLGFTDTQMVRTVDLDPVLGKMRASMPWPFGATRAAAPAVARLVRAVEGRKAHVYCPAWLRVMPWFRGAMPVLTARQGRSHAHSAEALLQQP
jgi:NAD(P)-dependent dehydrogenase (short-subunit alcohol dehydrogenase family)